MNTRFYVIYTRVSTKKQECSGLGLEAQRTLMLDYIKTNGGACLGEFTDVASGGGNPMKRKGFRDACLLANQHNCTLLVSHLDRLSRDFGFLITCTSRTAPVQWRKQPPILCPPVVAVGEANDYISTTIRALAAQMEHEAIKRRIKQALAVRRLAGDWTPGQANKEAGERRRALVAPLLPRIRAYRRHGRTLKWIVDKLNSEGLTTAKGNPWTITSLYRILQPS